MSIFEEPQPCDFCGQMTDDPAEFAADVASVGVAVTSLSGDVITGEIPTPGTWRACASCAELIEASDEDGLLCRSPELALADVALLARLAPERRRLLLREHRQGLKRLHDRFWQGVTDIGDDDEQEAAAS